MSNKENELEFLRIMRQIADRLDTVATELQILNQEGIVIFEGKTQNEN